MKLGYIGMPDTNRLQGAPFQHHEHLALAESLAFHSAYFPQKKPQDILNSDAAGGDIKIVLDAAGFAGVSPSDIETAVRDANDQFQGRLHLGVEICGPTDSAKIKTQSQAYETLSSYGQKSDQMFAQSRFPMKPPCPEIIGLPRSGVCSETRLAAARGYSPMTPSWLPEKDVARMWPAIVSGATSALRRAQPSQWQVNRVVVVHEDAKTVEAYVKGANSPIRRYFENLARRGLMTGDLDRHLSQTVIAGSAQKVAEDILSLRERVGTFGTLNIIDPRGRDANMTKTTMVRLAENVMPMVATSDVSQFKNLERT